MSCDAKTIIQGAVAQGYEGLESRSFLLSMAGALATSTGLNASQSVIGAKTQGYYGLSDRALDEALLAALCPSIIPPIPPIPPPSTAVTFTGVSPTTLSISAPVDLSIIGTNFKSTVSVQISVVQGVHVAGAFSNFVNSTTLIVPSASLSSVFPFASLVPGPADVQFSDSDGNFITLSGVLTLIA